MGYFILKIIGGKCFVYFKKSFRVLLIFSTGKVERLLKSKLTRRELFFIIVFSQKFLSISASELVSKKPKNHFKLLGIFKSTSETYVWEPVLLSVYTRFLYKVYYFWNCFFLHLWAGSFTPNLRLDPVSFYNLNIKMWR